MGGGYNEQAAVVQRGRAEIDTRAPFSSVKEAVALFGEKVLAGELYAGSRRLTTTTTVVNENRAAATWPNHHAATTAVPTAAAVVAVHHHQAPPAAPRLQELAEAKQELEKEREEKLKMQGCIQTLQEELSHAMTELKRLKARDNDEREAKVIDLQVDDIKFVEEDEKKHLHPTLAPPELGRRASGDYHSNNSAAGAGDGAGGEMQKKRYVTFADPPTGDVVMELHRAPSHPHPQPHYYRQPRFQRQMSAGHEPAAVKAATGIEAKKKKKPLIPLVGALFMRRKKSSNSPGRDDSF